jgi:TPR repeat protein
MGVSRVRYNDQDVQSIASDVCGLYACYFCKHGLPQTNKKAWRWLSSNVKNNDAEIRKLVYVQ